MRVFAEKPFRYNGSDYPYGWQDMPQALADTLYSSGTVRFSDNALDPLPPPYINTEMSWATRQSPHDFGVGLAIFSDYPNVICYSNGSSWNPDPTTVGSGSGSEISLQAYDAPTGSGALNNRISDSGHQWKCGGAGYLLAVVNAGGWIQGFDNTYCHLDAEAKIRRVEAEYSGGAMATLAIELDTGLVNMIHVNFSSGGSGAQPSVWKVGLGISIGAQWSKTLGTVPDLQDGNQHKLAIELVGDVLFCYADEVLIHISSHSEYSAVQGNLCFVQIHGTSGLEKITNVAAYTEVLASDMGTGVVTISGLNVKGNVSAKNIIVGDSNHAAFLPVSNSYFFTDATAGHVFSGSITTLLQIQASQAGYNAKIRLITGAINSTNFSDVVLDTSGNLRFSHRGNDRIVLPLATGETNFVGNINELSKSVVATAGLTSATISSKHTYFTGTAGASFAITLPAAASTIDGRKHTIMSTVDRPSTTWVSTGASGGFIGLPSALVANTPIVVQYDHATLAWYISK